ncbi:hypothetical protein AB0K80_01125 [Streptomyces sp. NPDC052682]|uniref:hypothetical protein n=1 Tax=Streptomyces sp. NPDC052682 TaxID=3154954 RepID=UPI003420FD2C
MSDQTPSQAEGDREEDPQNTADHPAPPYPTPSQAEGDRDDTAEDADQQGG